MILTWVLCITAKLLIKKNIHIYLIKNPEGLSDLLLTVSVFHLPCHHCKELRKVNGPVAWQRDGQMDFINTTLQNCEGGFKKTGLTKISIPSASTSLIMSWSSASVGFWPSDLMTVPSSLVVMVPSPSLSNREKASLNSVQAQRRENISNSRCNKTDTASQPMEEMCINC